MPASNGTRRGCKTTLCNSLDYSCNLGYVPAPSGNPAAPPKLSVIVTEEAFSLARLFTMCVAPQTIDFIKLADEGFATGYEPFT